MKNLSFIIILVGFIGAIPVKPFTNQHVYVGSGSGFLTLNNIQTAYSLVPGDTLSIVAGTYDGFYVENSRFTDSVYFFGSDSGTTISGTGEFKNCKSLVVAKLRWLNVSGRAMNLNTNCDSFTIRNCSFIRGVDYFIHLNDVSGNSFDNFQIINDSFHACGFANCINTAGAKTKNLLIRNCSFDSTYGGPGGPAACISITDMAQNYAIYQNRYVNINLSCTDHTSVNFLVGWGAFHDNYCFNRQGDFVRFRPYWTDSSATKPHPDTTSCYNNRCVSAVKYADYELQQFAADTTTNTSVPNVRSGAFIGTNNTSLNGRTNDYTPFTNSSGGGSGQWDIYTYYRNAIQIKNNACARMYIDSVPNPLSPPPAYTFNYMLHDGGGTRPSGMPRFGDTLNNIYYQVAAQLSPNWGGNDSLNMVLVSGSVARGASSNQFSYLFNTGFRGNARGQFWDAGADQFNVWLWGPVRWKAIKKVN